MRFSVLTLNLEGWHGSDDRAKLDRTARLIAEENVTCVCLQESVQSDATPLVDEASGLRKDNTAHVLRSRLEQYGLKYGLAWGVSRRGTGSFEQGAAVLSQLPILGQCSRFVSNEEDSGSAHSRNVVMARLAAAPNSVIDAYSTHLSPPEHGFDEQLSSLMAFVDDTPAVLEALKPPPPKRRGPPRKRVPVQEPHVVTRLVCVAGDLNVEPGRALGALVEQSYLEASVAAREASPAVGTTTDGRWLDYVFIKPALRPQGARVVFSGADAPPVSDHLGVLVEFEV